MNLIAVYLAEGFEETEAVTIIEVLRRAGLNVVTVSITGNRMVKGSHNIELKADLLFNEFDYKKESALLLRRAMLIE